MAWRDLRCAPQWGRVVLGSNALCVHNRYNHTADNKTTHGAAPTLYVLEEIVREVWHAQTQGQHGGYEVAM